MRFEFPDLLPGRYDLAMLMVLAGAGWYLHTQQYREDAVMRAAAFVGAAFGLSKAGEVRGESRGFQRGYNTYNPDLHRNDPPADVPFDVGEDLPVDPPFMAPPPPPPVMPVTLPDMPLEKPVEAVIERMAPDAPDVVQGVLTKLTVDELKKLARDRGMGGTWLSSARKAEIVARLIR